MSPINHKSGCQLAVETLGITATVVGLVLATIAIIALAKGLNAKDFMMKTFTNPMFITGASVALYTFTLLMWARCSHHRAETMRFRWR